MLNNSRHPRARRWVSGVSAALAAGFVSSERLLAAVAPQTATQTASQCRGGPFVLNYDHVLGTSLDAQINAPSERDARECERRMLGEIERLGKILNAYDPTSEINRVKAGAPVASRELAEVLLAYDEWSQRTGNALNSNLAGVIALWKQARLTGRLPDALALSAAMATPLALNIDALGKGYVIDRVVNVARQFSTSGLLNIGGDLRVWGDTEFIVGIADPRAPADNAAPLLQFPLREAAVATSAGYARSFTLGGKRYSHLIDPRTLRPIEYAASATIVAKDCLTANALSTAAAVLGGVEGETLARAYALDYLIFNSSARASSPQRSLGAWELSASQSASAAAAVPVAVENSAKVACPAGYEVSVNVVLKAPPGPRGRRPYVAIWVENADHKLVRTLAVWGLRERYLPSLSKWYGLTSHGETMLQTVSRATRGPGAYTVTWDGLDDQATAAPAGEYTIWMEVNREHGHHVYESASVVCGAAPTTAELHTTAESDASSVTYGPKPQ